MADRRGGGCDPGKHWPGTVAGLRGRQHEISVRRALESFVPGMLRTVADPARMAVHSSELAMVALAAMEYGATHLEAR